MDIYEFYEADAFIVSHVLGVQSTNKRCGLLKVLLPVHKLLPVGKTGTKILLIIKSIITIHNINARCKYCWEDWHKNHNILNISNESDSHDNLLTVNLKNHHTQCQNKLCLCL
eukprot:143915_1